MSVQVRLAALHKYKPQTPSLILILVRFASRKCTLLPQFYSQTIRFFWSPCTCEKWNGLHLRCIWWGGNASKVFDTFHLVRSNTWSHPSFFASWMHSRFAPQVHCGRWDQCTCGAKRDEQCMVYCIPSTPLRFFTSKIYNMHRRACISHHFTNRRFDQMHTHITSPM